MPAMRLPICDSFNQLTSSGALARQLFAFVYAILYSFFLSFSLFPCGKQTRVGIHICVGQQTTMQLANNKTCFHKHKQVQFLCLLECVCVSKAVLWVFRSKTRLSNLNMRRLFAFFFSDKEVRQLLLKQQRQQQQLFQSWPPPTLIFDFETRNACLCAFVSISPTVRVCVCLHCSQ